MKHRDNRLVASFTIEPVDTGEQIPDIEHPKLSGMPISKAIEILTNLLRDQPTRPPDERRKAVKLGIEALKREKMNRDNPDFVIVGPLPGETDD